MRIEKLRDLARQENLDVIVATSFENVRYLSGVAIHTQYLIPQRLAVLIVPVQAAEPTFVVCTIEESLVRQESQVKNIYGYQEFKDSPLAVVADVLKNHHFERGCIGVELETMPAKLYQELVAFLPAAQFAPVDGLFDRLRMIKDSEEVALLERTALATDRAIRKAYENAHPGLTELEVLHTLTSILIQNGAESLPFLNLGAGPNAVHTHPSAGEYRLKEGDLLGCDVGGRWTGYFSDLARTAVVGKATQHQRDVYKVLWEVHETVIDSIRPGIAPSDLYSMCSTHFEQNGMRLSLSHIGHSLGLVLHERPMISPAETIVLERGMVIAIEPATRDETGKYHTEDLILVTDTGNRVLSRFADWSSLLVID